MSNSRTPIQKNGLFSSNNQIDNPLRETQPFNHDVRFKVITLGNAATGKSFLVNRMTKTDFDGRRNGSVGADHQRLEFTHPVGGGKVILDIWDTSGQERFHAITAGYLRGAEAALVLYDITDLRSYNDANTTWLNKANEYRVKKTYLIGNKTDLKDQRLVESTRAKNEAAKNGYSRHLEVSALTNEGVPELLQEVVTSLCNDYALENAKSVQQRVLVQRDVVQLGRNNNAGNDTTTDSCCSGMSTGPRDEGIEIDDSAWVNPRPR